MSLRRLSAQHSSLRRIPGLRTLAEPAGGKRQLDLLHQYAPAGLAAGAAARCAARCDRARTATDAVRKSTACGPPGAAAAAGGAGAAAGDGTVDGTGDGTGVLGYLDACAALGVLPKRTVAHGLLEGRRLGLAGWTTPPLMLSPRHSLSHSRKRARTRARAPYCALCGARPPRPSRNSEFPFRRDAGRPSGANGGAIR